MHSVPLAARLNLRTGGRNEKSGDKKNARQPGEDSLPNRQPGISFAFD